LITDAEKAVIADRLAESLDNFQISPLLNIVQASCSVLEDGGFNTDTSTYKKSFLFFPFLLIPTL
jgi:hypothetical protein